MILCVTLNPAVDRTAHVNRVQLGEILRPSELLALPGGKGVNVARAAHGLGADVTTTGVVGGHAGRWIVDELEREGLNPRFVDTGRESRTTYVIAGDDGRWAAVYEKGLEQPEAAFEQMLVLLGSGLLTGCEFVIIAGSVPPGIDPAYLGRIVASCIAVGVRCLVDARDKSLLAGLARRPSIVKANLEEYLDAGLESAQKDPVQIARAAVKAGADASIVTLGANGAVACQGSKCWRLTVPRQRAVSSVGAGDAFTAGLVVALTRSIPFEEALCHAGAAAAASVLMLGAGRVDRSTMDRLLPSVHARLVQ